MKSIFTYILLIFLWPLIGAQEILNGNFDQWEIIDGIEEPVGWIVHNPECCITVEKTEGSDGVGYAIRIITNVQHWEGFDPAEAGFVFLPAFSYQYLHADVWVEKIEPGGKARIVLGEKNGEQYFESVGWREVYEEIGVWEVDTVTSGFIPVTIPFEQKTFDKFSIRLIAETTLNPPTGSDGYCSMRVDNVRLSPQPFPVQENSITIFPNPSINQFKVWWPRGTDISAIRVLTLLGQLVYEQAVPTDVSFVEVGHDDWAWGTYIVQLLDKDDKITHNGKLVVTR